MQDIGSAVKVGQLLESTRWTQILVMRSVLCPATRTLFASPQSALAPKLTSDLYYIRLLK